MEFGHGILALDIGTRSIVGLVVKKQGEDYVILAQESVEHKSRVMYDGQIHDIASVADSVQLLKLRLEEKLGFPLQEAAVAAAGRALLTISSTAKKTISPYNEVSEEDIKGLEAEALTLAGKNLAKQHNGRGFEEYYCVGYNPIKYYLDDIALDNLLGQKGRHISVEIVATFLPRSVVDSLMTVLSRCGLTLSSITLEPIAASSVAILPGMRKLNIALVDIGAGTSDIAISTDGSIFAYGMVPLAGDEITEKISELYLLDFYTAEKVKRALGSEDHVEFDDILGNHHRVSSQEVLQSLMPHIHDLSQNIARKILELNGRVPAAVILIGGASQLPGLSASIAQNLGLPAARVGVKGREGINFIQGGEELKGPFAVTPIGIAITALEERTLSFIKVEVDGRTVHLLGQENPTVLDALIHAGYSSAKIFGRPGLALTFTLNGELKVVPGKRGKASKVTLDGNPVALDSPVQDNAVIDFIPGEDGGRAQVKVGDFISNEHKTTIYINGRDLDVDPHIEINGAPASPKDEIPEKAVVTLRPRELILSDIFGIISFKPEATLGKLVTKINGVEAGFTAPVKPGDRVDIYWQNGS